MESPEKNSDVSSTASETRKNSKPVMEKKRRARINASLAELKSLLLDVMKAEGTRQNKMEKADILEMTVRHLRQLQRQQFSALSATDPAVINKYRLGFNECASEVSKYLANMDGLNTDFRARLLNHLANITTNTEQPEETKEPKSPPLTKISHQGPYPKVNSNAAQSNPGHVLKVNGNVTMSSNVSAEVLRNVKSLEVNGNITAHKSENVICSEQNIPSKIIQGVHTIPTQMSSGDVAFIIPAANMVQYGTIPNYVIPVLQPQGGFQISHSSNSVIQTHQTVPIAYSGGITTSHGVLPSFLQNTTFVNSSPNTVGLPVSLVSSGNGIAVQQHEPQFTAFPVTNARTQVTHSPKIDVLSDNNNTKITNEGSLLKATGVVPPLESRFTHGLEDKTDPMWRPW
ncbi:transcription factor HES-4-A-like [Saccostrea echinata]|uniref:transcription factor HES-4-A-like n=1 Tax=Saccostrea echinata TaxID=191078 RepID=UPI002A818D8B|nr:transcription factor HES-4-A-like [Saccostrea echinata]